MKKKLLISALCVLILLILGLVGYYLWFYKKPLPSTAEQAVTDIQKTVESIDQNVAGSIFSSTTANPMENVPNVNPYKDTNPFSNIKTNPFQ